VADTGTEHGTARCHPFFKPADIERLEMACVTGAGRELPVTKPKVKSFWMEVGENGGVLGASDGEETPYLYAERTMSGDVHGRPMTARQLRARGADL
jgi:hypothetical protein